MRDYNEDYNEDYGPKVEEVVTIDSQGNCTSDDFNADFSNDFCLFELDAPTKNLQSNITTSYFLNAYAEEVLNLALVRFTENNLKIEKLECIGKDPTKLYVENRQILAIFKYFTTKFPCDEKDVALNCLLSLGVKEQVKTFDYFNTDCLRLLETGDNRLLEETGFRLLEGICSNLGDSTRYTCACGDTGVYYQDSSGSVKAMSNYIVNTNNYTD